MKTQIKVLRGDEWQVEEELVLKKENLRMEIIWLYYDVPVAGHEERWKMTELMMKNYWWPEVTKYVNRCNMC